MFNTNFEVVIKQNTKPLFKMTTTAIYFYDLTHYALKTKNDR